MSLYRFAALLLLTLLAGCGFQLQGSFTTPSEMERTYIAADDKHSLFYRELRATLKASGVDLVDNAADATATFTIVFGSSTRSLLSSEM